VRAKAVILMREISLHRPKRDTSSCRKLATSSGWSQTSVLRFLPLKFQGSFDLPAAGQQTELRERARTSDGVAPYRRRKARLKCERSPKPAS
jgi:hypothetical protein